MITQKLEVHTGHPGVPRAINVVQADSGRTLECILQEGTPTGATSARFFAVKPSGLVIYNNAVLSGNKVTVGLTNQTLAEDGKVACQIELLDANENRVTSFEFVLLVHKTLITENAIESTNEANALKEYVENAKKSAEAAAKSEQNAKTYEGNAANSATQSQDWMNKSKSWAIGEGDTSRTDQATNNSKYFATQAAGSATQAAGSATQAGKDATRAETARTGAEAAQAGAQTARTAAEAAQKNAETAKDGAVTAQKAAESSATQAAKSLTDATAQAKAAAGSAAAALASQTAAETAKDGAVAAQGKAEAAQTAAETAKNAASASQAEAAKSASAASASQTAAAASATQAENWSNQSQSWAVGTGYPSRTNQATDNSKYYAGQAAESAKLAQSIAQGQKGYYETQASLKSANPTGKDGDWAIVGDTDTIWVWDSDTNTWADSGNKTDLSQYYTKTEADEKYVNKAGDIVTGILTEQGGTRGWIPSENSGKAWPLCIGELSFAQKFNSHPIIFELSCRNQGDQASVNASVILQITFSEAMPPNDKLKCFYFSGNSNEGPKFYLHRAGEGVYKLYYKRARGWDRAFIMRCHLNNLTAFTPMSSIIETLPSDAVQATWNPFETNPSHTHDAANITSGTLPAARGGTGNTEGRAIPLMQYFTKKDPIEPYNVRTGFYNIENVDIGTNQGHFHRVLALGDHIQTPSGYSTEIAFGYEAGKVHPPLIRQASNSAWTNWETFYTTANKPTAADVGALASNGKAVSANTADKLSTARTFPAVNLASAATASFDGSANPTALGVSGVLPVANGGTGNSAVDTTPTQNSTKMVTSDGVYTALAGKAASSHTHNYAGSPTAGGAANSVVHTLKAGNKSYNGSADITLVASDVGAAATTHTHRADEINSGVLPVANGGTGNSTIDVTPTLNSTKMITSGGVYNALQKITAAVPIITSDSEPDVSPKVATCPQTITDGMFAILVLTKGNNVILRNNLTIKLNGEERTFFVSDGSAYIMAQNFPVFAAFPVYACTISGEKLFYLLM